MGKSLKNVVSPDDDVRRLRGRHPPPVRDGHGAPRRVAAVEHTRRRRHAPLPATAVAQPGRRGDGRAAGRTTSPPTRRPAGCCTAPSTAWPPTWSGLRFNTAMAKLIELNNHLTSVAAEAGSPARGGRAAGADDGAAGAPRGRGAVGSASATTSRWPTSPSPWPTPRCSSPTTVEYPVQVNGKVRARVEVPADADAATVEAAALADPRLSRGPGRRHPQEGHRGARPAGVGRRLAVGSISRSHGAVAQLVEHFHGMEGVRGSIPLSSTRARRRHATRSDGVSGRRWPTRAGGRRATTARGRRRRASWCRRRARRGRRSR